MPSVQAGSKPRWTPRIRLAATNSDADNTGRVPMARFATPDDVAFAIAFLADEKESGFINGHSLSVDGGWASDGSWQSLRLSHR
jgi:NAD(P)-dependent dehydrogenase (short-subunit alcohol dehydrogenase family)